MVERSLGLPMGMKMSFKQKRVFAVIVLFFLLGVLSLFSAEAGPDHRPRTVQIIENPEEHENEYIPGISGKILSYRIDQGEIILNLERFGRTFEVRGRENLIDEPKALERDDIIQVRGYPRLISGNYVEAVEIMHRPQERGERLFLLSYLGLALLLVILVRDRKDLLELVPLA